eukprot:Sspe_Gene.75143::Locus_46954_Transcript_1_1_Confidence_1.000_Length_758::g.75143::m.75143
MRTSLTYTVLLVAAVGTCSGMAFGPTEEKLYTSGKEAFLEWWNKERRENGACPLEWDDKLEEDVRVTMSEPLDPTTPWCRMKGNGVNEITGDIYTYTGYDDTVRPDWPNVIASMQTPEFMKIIRWKSVSRVGCGQCRVGSHSTSSAGHFFYTVCRFEELTGSEADNVGQPGEQCDCRGCVVDQCHVAGMCDAMTGKCSSSPKSDGVPCDDGDGTTFDDKCTAGKCQGTVAGPT